MSQYREVVIVAAKRTAIGAFNGALSSVPAHELGAAVLRDILKSTGLKPESVDEVILGQVLTAGCGQNPARQAALVAGLPDTVSAMTINKVCGSGLKAIGLASQAIATGEADIVFAGGQENMSLSPHLLPKSRQGQRLGNWELVDSMIKDGLWDAFNQYHMGITAENVAEQYQFNREELDAFAEASHRKAVAAQEAGRFDDEIVGIEIPQRKGDPLTVNRDEGPRADADALSLARLKAAFKKEGLVTAGNASSLNDGAAVVLMMSADKAAELGLKPLVKIAAFSSAGVDPSIMGTGPIPATRRCLSRAGWTLEELDLVEANEAFAAQAMAVNKTLGWDVDRINVNGGAIALGHPIGASGCRITVTLIHEMLRRDAKKGLATLCIGGGMGVALAVERASEHSK